MRTVADGARTAGLGGVAFTVALSAAAGLGVAGLLLALDAAGGRDAVPDALRIGPATAQSLLLGLAVAYLAATAFIVRLRAFALQGSAAGLPARMTRRLLGDRVQRRATGFVVGALVFNLVVLRAVPADGAGMVAVPQLAVNVATLLPLAVAVVIVAIVHDAARGGGAGRLVHRLADDCLALVRARADRAGDELDERLDTLVDIAERALAQGSRDTTTARHVILNITAVLRQTLDLPAPSDERVAALLGRLRDAACSSADAATTLAACLATLTREARAAGRVERAALLSEQVELLIAGAERSHALEDDVRRVRAAAATGPRS
jgi:uncharacterized membrane protein